MSDSKQQQTIVTNQQVSEAAPLHAWISQNLDVLVKLMVFTAALFAFPIVTFFVTLHSLFDGNTTYAGGAAALMANVIVGLYIVVAMLERPKESVTNEKKKD
ncbi:hypothetical protein INT46_002610 [Mucor plumbeus]|uniref:Vacuolar ATPase assembly integral membrane protein VMA21 n=1 Tax=Mucor plumbeus TaxID=97098 RepID=A0A8H7RFN3_9FUNG|nr:hypothetical protein INT46_002610 [Mucor plumbeus]